MNNGTTMTVIARGCEWCSTCLYDGWGDCDEATSKRLGGLVRDLLHGVCGRLGRTDIVWYPATSEVHGLAACNEHDRSRCYAGIDGGDPPLDLDAIHEAVSAAVYDRGEEAIDGNVTIDGVLDQMGDLRRFVAV